jgi:hypothetical protein
MKALLGVKPVIKLQEQRSMVRVGRKGLEVRPGVEGLPTLRDKHPVNTFQSWVQPLVAPSEKTTTEMELRQLKVIKQPSKTTHHLSRKTTISLIRRLVYQVEIPTNYPRARQGWPKVTQLLQKADLLSIPLRAINISQPPSDI